MIDIVEHFKSGEAVTARCIALRSNQKQKMVKWALRSLERSGKVKRIVRAPLSINKHVLWCLE